MVGGFQRSGVQALMIRPSHERMDRSADSSSVKKPTTERRHRVCAIERPCTATHTSDHRRHRSALAAVRQARRLRCGGNPTTYPASETWASLRPPDTSCSRPAPPDGQVAPRGPRPPFREPRITTHSPAAGRLRSRPASSGCVLRRADGCRPQPPSAQPRDARLGASSRRGVRRAC